MNVRDRVLRSVDGLNASTGVSGGHPEMCWRDCHTWVTRKQSAHPSGLCTDCHRELSGEGEPPTRQETPR